MEKKIFFVVISKRFLVNMAQFVEMSTQRHPKLLKVLHLHFLQLISSLVAEAIGPGERLRLRRVFPAREDNYPSDEFEVLPGFSYQWDVPGTSLKGAILIRWTTSTNSFRCRGAATLLWAPHPVFKTEPVHLYMDSSLVGKIVNVRSMAGSRQGKVPGCAFSCQHRPFPRT